MSCWRRAAGGGGDVACGMWRVAHGRKEARSWSSTSGASSGACVPCLYCTLALTCARLCARVLDGCWACGGALAPVGPPPPLSPLSLAPLAPLARAQASGPASLCREARAVVVSRAESCWRALPAACLQAHLQARLASASAGASTPRAPHVEVAGKMEAGPRSAVAGGGRQVAGGAWRGGVVVGADGVNCGVGVANGGGGAYAGREGRNESMLELIQDDDEAVEHACPMHDMMRAPDAAAFDDNATVRAMAPARAAAVSLDACPLHACSACPAALPDHVPPLLWLSVIKACVCARKRCGGWRDDGEGGGGESQGEGGARVRRVRRVRHADVGAGGQEHDILAPVGLAGRLRLQHAPRSGSLPFPPSLSRPPSPTLPPLPSNLASPTLLCLRQEARGVQRTAALVLPAPASRAHIHETSRFRVGVRRLAARRCVWWARMPFLREGGRREGVCACMYVSEVSGCDRVWVARAASGGAALQAVGAQPAGARRRDHPV